MGVLTKNNLGYTQPFPFDETSPRLGMVKIRFGESTVRVPHLTALRILPRYPSPSGLGYV